MAAASYPLKSSSIYNMSSLARRTTQCPRFSQNAWKKDLCSNCFKSKEEHKKQEAIRAAAEKARIADSIKNTPENKAKPKQSILKKISKISNKKSVSNGVTNLNGSNDKEKNGGITLKVNFPTEESEVIGYGGDDEYGVSSDNESSHDEDYDDDYDDGHDNIENLVDNNDKDDIDLQQLTKNNTDFNSITANLSIESSNIENDNSNNVKKLHIPLKLGQNQNGQKQTLLVSVKPFGSNIDTNNKRNNANINSNMDSINQKSTSNLSTTENVCDISSDKSDKLKKTADVIKVTSDNSDKQIGDNNKSITNDNNCENNSHNVSGKGTNDDISNNNENSAIVGSKHNDVKHADKLLINNIDNSLINTKTNDDTITGNSNDYVKDDTKSINDITVESLENKKTTNLTRGGIILTKNSEQQIKTKRYQLISYNNSNTLTNNNSSKLNKSLLENDDIKKENKISEDDKNTLNKEKENFKYSITTPNIMESNLVKTNNLISSKLKDNNFKNLLTGSNDNTDISKSNCDNHYKISLINKEKQETNDSNIKISFNNDTKNGIVIGVPAVIVSDDDDNGNDSLLLPSRELVGEPDGRADSDDTNEPSLNLIPSRSNTPLLSSTPTVIIPTSHQVSSQVSQPSSPRSPPTTPPPPPPFLNKSQNSPSPHSHHPRSSFLHSLQSTKIQQSLQVNIVDKPSLPIKPNILTSNSTNGSSNSTTTSDEAYHQHTEMPLLTKTIVLSTVEPPTSVVGISDVSSMNSNTENNTPQQQIVPKRQAPKPPPQMQSCPTTCEQPLTTIQDVTSADVTNSCSTFNSNSNCTTDNNSAVRRTSFSSRSDSIEGSGTPVLKYRDKNPFNRNSNNISPTYEFASHPVTTVRSLSHDSLSLSPPMAIPSASSITHNNNKRGSKVRSTLRKLLRFGSSREDDYSLVFDNDSTSSTANSSGNVSSPMTPRPRLEIIHPLDLNKSGVQVLKNTTNTDLLQQSNKTDDNFSSSSNINGNVNSQNPASYHYQNHLPSNHVNHHHHHGHHGQHQFHHGRPSKPPPPPRSQSLDANLLRGPVPARPPPPLHIPNATSSLSTNSTIVTMNTTSTGVIAETGVYANIGDVRQDVIPVKPQRSSSIRENNVKGNTAVTKKRNTAIQEQQVSINNENNLYETIEPVPSANNNTYGNINETNVYCDIYNNIDVSVGSAQSTPQGNSTYQLGVGHVTKLNPQKQSATVIHNSLEDNYGAVIIANHEALTQLLEQVNRSQSVTSTTPGYISLKDTPHLKWTDFVLGNLSEAMTIGSSMFYNAEYNDRKANTKFPLTVCVTDSNCSKVTLPGINKMAQSMNSSTDKYLGCLQVINEFNDIIPRHLVNSNSDTSSANDKEDVIQASILVFPRVSLVAPLCRYKWPNDSNYVINNGENNTMKLANMKDSAIVFLKLIHCLLVLQSRNINYVDKNNVIVCKQMNCGNGNCDNNFNGETQFLILTNHNDNSSGNNQSLLSTQSSTVVSLHQYIIDILSSSLSILPSHLTTLLYKLLKQNSSSLSLSSAKVLLELWLWGPRTDLLQQIPNAINNDRHTIIKRWLDLERANLLQSLLMSCQQLPLKLNESDHCHLTFLVQTNAKIIDDTLKLYENYRSNQK